MKKVKVAFLVLGVFVLLAFDHGSYKPASCREFCAYIVDDFKLHSDPTVASYFFTFNEKYRVRLTLRDFPAEIPRDRKQVFFLLSKMSGLPESFFDRFINHYTLELLDEVDPTRGCIVFLWQSQLLADLAKETVQYQEVDLFCHLIGYADQQKTAYALVNDFQTRLLDMNRGEAP